MAVILFLLLIIMVLFIWAKDIQNSKGPHPPVRDSNQHRQTSEAADEQMKYFYVNDKGYHVSVWPKDQGMQNIDYIEFNIAGITHRENIELYLGEHVGTLEPEPGNPYDVNAIKILAEDGHHVGYVPKNMTVDVRNFTALPCKCYFYIGDNNGIYYTDAYINRL